MNGKRRGHGEGSIYRRNDGTWVGAADLGSIGGKRQRKLVYAKTQAEVRKALRDLQQALEVGAMPPPRG